MKSLNNAHTSVFSGMGAARDEQAVSAQAAGGGRKVYRSPALTLYGRLGDLTKAGGNDDLDAAFEGSSVTT